MNIILPSGNTSLKEVVDDLDKLNDQHYTTYETAEVSLYLPAFSFKYKRDLKNDLQEMGVHDAFNEDCSANFSKMSVSPLYVENIIHKTFVDVNENGTEAAALTAIGMETTAMADEDEEAPRSVDFIVDRDFIFEIIDRSSGVVVFIGQHKI